MIRQDMFAVPIAVIPVASATIRQRLDVLWEGKSSVNLSSLLALNKLLSDNNAAVLETEL